MQLIGSLFVVSSFILTAGTDVSVIHRIHELLTPARLWNQVCGEVGIKSELGVAKSVKVEGFCSL